MEKQMDSLGQLPSPVKSSDNSTQTPALNVKLLGSDFEKQADGEVMAKQLYRLASVFGDPWGKDQTMLRQMASEWLEALRDMPAATIERGISEWVKTGERWPKPSDIRKTAMAQVERRVSRVSSERKMHERRLNPSKEMQAYTFRTASIRRNPNWAAFLDMLHPTVEDNFFAEARLGDYENVLYVPEQFHVDYIKNSLGQRMQDHFGARVIVRKAVP